MEKYVLNSNFELEPLFQLSITNGDNFQVKECFMKPSTKDSVHCKKWWPEMHIGEVAL